MSMSLPQFKNESLLRRALSHSSANKSASNERLEFLGDRVVGLVAAQMLFESYPDLPEGELALRHSKIVSAKSLAEEAARLGLGEMILLSAQEKRRGGANNENILSDAFEAVAGALFLDGGYVAAEKFLRAAMKDKIIAAGVFAKDSKTHLQEECQKRFGAPPKYTLQKQSGLDHMPLFEVIVRVGNESFLGAGKSKKDAEQAAAAAALRGFAND